MKSIVRRFDQKVNSVSIQGRLVIICVATALFAATLLAGLYQVAKTSHYHYINVLHYKNIAVLDEHLRSIHAKYGSKIPASAVELLREDVLHIREQPMECLSMMGVVEKALMHLIHTDQALSLCQEDIQVANHVMVVTEEYLRGAIGTPMLLKAYRDAKVAFTEHGRDFLLPISQTADSIVSFTLTTFSLLSGVLVTGLIALARSITANLREMAETARALNESERRNYLAAHYDNLTCLATRYLFLQQLDHALATGSPFALLFIDLDRFKSVNDTVGHGAGDDVLKEAANRLREACPQALSIARLAGDEFVMLIGDEVDPEFTAQRTAATINEAMRHPFRLSHGDVRLSASIGVTLYPRDASSGEALLKNADMAMYWAKANGRDKYNVYNAELDAQIRRKTQIEQSLPGAWERGEMVLHFQPVVSVDSGEIVGAEALLRWRSPTLGPVAPDNFIPIAEELGQIMPLGRWVMEQACQQAQLWREQYGKDFRLAVNVSAFELRQAEFADRFVATLKRHDLPTAAIDVEVTESQMLEDNAQCITNLRLLAAQGIRLFLDDFGRGYSSFSYLRELPFDVLKIDRSFTAEGLFASTAHCNVLASMVILAHQMGMQVVAEGVETAAVFQHLRYLGCDYAQGYYFGRPVSADQFAANPVELPDILPETMDMPTRGTAINYIPAE